MAADSILNSSAERWREVLGKYDDVLRAMAKTKKKDKANELIELDKWFQQELPTTVGKRSEKHLTKEELVKLMTWKLSRGKFRPRLVDLIKSNSEGKIVSTTMTAFALLPDVEKAIKTLSVLHGIGPATASGKDLVVESFISGLKMKKEYVGVILHPATMYILEFSAGGNIWTGTEAVLCVCSPCVPFMADEAMTALPMGRGKLQYTPKAYLQYLHELRSTLENLQEQDSDGEWNEHKVEMTLWTHVTAMKYAPELLQSTGTTQSRKRETEESGQAAKEQRKRKKV